MSSVMSILIAQIVVKLLGFLYRIVITNIDGFGDAGNGYYNAGFQFYTLLLAISSVGIPNAISKLTAGAAARGDRARAHMIFRTALWLFLGIGLVCSCLLYMGADFIALTVIKMDGVQYTLKALAPSILFVCLSSVIRGYFMGLGNASPTGRSQMLEQALKSSMTIIFVMVLSAYSAKVMSAGANLATSVATLFSFGYLLCYYLRRRSGILEGMETDMSLGKREFLHYAKAILFMSIPISFSSIIMSAGRVVDTATITRGIAKAFAFGIPGEVGIPTAAELNSKAVELAGMLAKSDPLTNLPLALNVAFASVLVPTISAAIAKGDRQEANSKISFSMLISILIILPCMTGLILFAKPIFLMIYPGAPDGWQLLQISAAGMAFAAMDQTLCGSLQGLGKVLVPAKALMIGVLVKIALNLTLIPITGINIYGAAISSVVCHGLACTICYRSLKKELSLPLELKKYFLKPAAACLIMAAVSAACYLLVFQLTQSNRIALLAAILFAVVIYAIAVLSMKILNEEELKQLPLVNKLRSK
ncbi:polysaccharide biosynthesis protein [Anaerovorax odorimutans]|uniref:Polysaccharide biosynthesis protein n=2 Tax=Anaerovorax odorimutans TaxID=109327 RepID=A0ABT1RJ74_9FIRM|nr:polysaccharide biosynthesis protein [Anaerovorax odorimutans]